MELKDLTALGITEEQANRVLEQHTVELNAEQQKYTDLSAELETAKGTISELTDKVKAFDGEDIEGLKKAASDWESKYNADIAALKLDKALELSLPGQKQEMWALSSLRSTHRSSSLTMKASLQV